MRNDTCWLLSVRASNEKGRGKAGIYEDAKIKTKSEPYARQIISNIYCTFEDKEANGMLCIAGNGEDIINIPVFGTLKLENWYITSEPGGYLQLKLTCNEKKSRGYIVVNGYTG